MKRWYEVFMENRGLVAPAGVLAIPTAILTDIGYVLLLVIILFILDVFTKQLHISISFCKAKEYKPTIKNVFRAFFFRAWIPGYLESVKMRDSVCNKLVPYMILIVTSIVLFLLPDKKLFGIYPDEAIAAAIWLFIALIEIFSIVENLHLLGFREAGTLREILNGIMQKYLGAKLPDKKEGEQ